MYRNVTPFPMVALSDSTILVLFISLLIPDSLAAEGFPLHDSQQRQSPPKVARRRQSIDRCDDFKSLGIRTIFKATLVL